MKKILQTLAAGALIATASAASAVEPITLSEVEMDGVTAAGFANAQALANAFGLVDSASSTFTFTQVQVIQTIPVQAGTINVLDVFSQATSQASAI